ncbi:MAG: signal recognition particle protein [Fimbriimonadales bacterium]|jgi:signal recognition particle subunit SRP54|nr:signal recognition particle protein [Fimbriimonadales bacterium]
MFESLTDKLQGIFSRIRGKGRLDEKTVDEVLREIRLALLEADVNFRVVKEFIARVREKAVGDEVLKSLTPDQHVVRIVRDELIALLGGEAEPIRWASSPPTVFMLCGLQGSGKTTTCAKLARWARSQGRKPMMAACDLQRPAAIKQLEVLGEQVGVYVHTPEKAGVSDPVSVARSAYAYARANGYDVLILDTAGRLQIDEPLMQELQQMRDALQPHEILLVVDATTGQEAVNVAQAFNERLELTGVILTKMDGDARGGAALSLKAVMGKPVRFIGVGERTDALEPFYPDRIASRILGMGDVLSLIERVEQTMQEEEAKRMEKKLREASFDFEDMLMQMQQIRRMGPFEQLLKLLPGYNQLKQQLGEMAIDDRALKRAEAIILSMTPQERRHPEIINYSRKARIARGSGTKIEEVSALINQLMEMRKLMKQLNKYQQTMQKRGKWFRMGRGR